MTLILRQEKLWHCFDAYYILLYAYSDILWAQKCRMHLHLWRSFSAWAPGEASLKVVGLIWLVLCDRWDLRSTRELLFMEMTSWAISKILIVIKMILFCDSEQTVLMPCERGTTLVRHWTHATWITSCAINSLLSSIWMSINQSLGLCIILFQSKF